MLGTYLHGFISKFIIVEDDLEEPGDKLFKTLLNSAFSSKVGIIYWQFSFNLSKNIKDKAQLSAHYDFTKLFPLESVETIQKLTNNQQNDSILIIDSLAHMFYKLGGKETYKTLRKVVQITELKQVLTMLHSDLLLENDEIVQHCSSIASLHIKIERQFREARRLSYLFRKGRGKVIRETEEFCVTHGKVVTRPITKLDVSSLLAEDNPSINSLTTFNIELNERDKMSRSQMNLPFLPKDLKSNDEKQGEIHYVFDAGDDWDAEDPDDDLDI